MYTWFNANPTTSGESLSMDFSISDCAHTTKLYLRTLGVRGLLCALKSLATGTLIEMEATRPEIKFPFYLRVPSSDVQVCWQIFVNRDYDFQVTTHPEVIIDAGANIGLASIYFANKFPNSLILSIEPEESNFALLAKNVAKYENIIPIHAALWGNNSELDLVDCGLGKWGFMTQGDDIKEASLAKKCHRVRGMTVDEIMASKGIQAVDILKIDIEGAEREVFQDPSRWIGKVDSLIVELHERMKPGCNRSFYNSTNDFDEEWQQGENVYLARNKGCLARRSN
jgi:FkbM family methyltransferase